MRARGGVTRCPITPQQRALMRAAQQRVAQILAHGATPEQVAQARADIEASQHPRQSRLALKVRQ